MISVRGLEQGGDDYLTKPFALAELLARLRNLLKRNNPVTGETTRLRVQDLELDLLRREASRGGQLLQLTRQEFILLEYLCRNAGRVVTRSMILDQVWGMRIQPDTNVVDVHIYRLRGKVDGAGQQPLIRTMRGYGLCPQRPVKHPSCTVPRGGSQPWATVAFAFGTLMVFVFAPSLCLP